VLKLLGLGATLALAACAPAPEEAPAAPVNDTHPATDAPLDAAAPTDTNAPPTTDTGGAGDPAATNPLILNDPETLATPLHLAPLPGQEWMAIPVVPQSLSERMRAVFRFGRQNGRDARRFSVIGDCQSIPVYFLTNFDGTSGSDYYLGDTYADLQETIDWYKGSFGGGVAATGGQNVAAVFSPFWADPTLCETNEGPLACELRRGNPSLALISLEENWNGDEAGYRENLENIVRYAIQQGVIPVLTTKANNLEGDHAINRTIVEVARAYELPLWNYWLSLQDLPQKGLIEDGFHLSQGWSPRFDYRDVSQIKSGWAMRNLTALQVLDALREMLNEELG
jgi:hypothetical protein